MEKVLPRHNESKELRVNHNTILSVELPHLIAEGRSYDIVNVETLQYLEIRWLRNLQ